MLKFAQLATSVKSRYRAADAVTVVAASEQQEQTLPGGPGRRSTYDGSIMQTLAGRVHLALDRFDRALRRHMPGDAMTELAISLDSLLGDGEGELTWKVSLRSALLVAGTKLERLERRAVIQAMYRLRSKVVHTGRTPTSIVKRGHGKLSPAALIPMAMITTAEVISAAIYVENCLIGSTRSLTLDPHPQARVRLAPSGKWNDDDFDVLCDGVVVGRVMKAAAVPVGQSWMWTLAFGQHEDRTPTHGYAATRETAMAASAESGEENEFSKNRVRRRCR